jgi:cobalt-zinc-cadmium efflux system outer membrane protein
MLKRLIVWCCAASLGASVSFAQEPTIPEKLTLAQALTVALERNPTLTAARGDVDIASADRIGARLRPNPALTLDSEGYPLGQGGGQGFFNNQELTIRIDQEIDVGSRRALRTSIAEAGVKSAQARFENARRILTLDVQRAYFQAVLATADRDVARMALQEIDQALGLNRSRFEQGEISGGELRRLQVERLRFVDDVFAAELALRNARSALLALMNVNNLSQAFEVTEPLAANPVPASPTPPGVVTAVQTSVIGEQASALIAAAIARRPDVLAAQHEVTRTDTQTRFQRALRTPNVTLGAGYKRDFGTNAVVFGATMPLPFGNRNQGGVARADAERQQAASRVRAVELVVRLEVQQAANAVDVNRERVQYIEREYLTTARDSRDIVLASYRLGAADLIDFLDAQRAYRDTVRTYNRALYDQRVSLFELAAATAQPAAQP